MTYWWVLTLVFVSQFSFGESFSSEAETREILSLSATVPVFAAVKANRAAEAKIVKAYHARIDKLVQQMLAGKPLFPCDLSKAPSQLPRLILQFENHEDAETSKRHERRLKQARRGELIYLLEFIVRGDAGSRRDWLKGNEFETYDPGPTYLRGMAEGSSEALAQWMYEGHAALPFRDPNREKSGVDAIIKARLAFSKSLVLTESGPKKVLGIIERSLSETRAKEVLTLLREIDDSPKEAAAAINRFAKAGLYDDEVGWEETVREILDHTYRLKYEKLATAEEKKAWKRFLRDPNMMTAEDYPYQVVIDWRSAEFAINLAAEYCESVNLARPLPVVAGMGAMHGYMVKRILEDGGKGVKPVVEILPGVLVIIKEMKKERDSGR